MNFTGQIICTVVIITSMGMAQADQRITDKDLGLSKTSVFESPESPPVVYSDKFPGSSERLPRAYLNAPPQIPHDIESFIPVKTGNNMCLGCHNRPDAMGQKPQKGIPTAMPVSHYTDLRNAPDKVRKQPVGARFNCTQCHVPQATDKPLVENTFKSQEGYSLNRVVWPFSKHT